MKILALDPWMGGSHRQLLEGWARHSRHSVEMLGLPPRHWKWRLSGGAWALAREIQRANTQKPDALWVSDFVDLPQLRGFLPPDWSHIPALLYFHENQLTYPKQAQAPFQEDLAPGWTHILSCLAADRIVFNSAFHLEQFRTAGTALLERLPKPKPNREFLAALDHAQVIHPGIDVAFFAVGPGAPPEAPLRIAFNHRWEYDKGPLAWLETARLALAHGARLELVLLGERSQDPGPEYTDLLEELAPHIRVRGHAASRDEYAHLLAHCDLVVSCATHEFYGMAVLEAVSAGCTPLAPNALAYPEVLAGVPTMLPLYDSDAQRLECLLAAAQDPQTFRESQYRQSLHDACHCHHLAHTYEQLDGITLSTVSGTLPTNP